MAKVLVPDTSVLVDGRISELLRTDHPGAEVHVPLAALAELEAQANHGLETGFTGLDELQNLQRLATEGVATVRFVGRRPSAEEIARAESGTVDALIRDAAIEAGGLFVTSDRVQAHAAAAQGLEHIWIRPQVDEDPDMTGLGVWSYFDDETMSVHLKSDCVPMVKRGKPGEVAYEPWNDVEMEHKDVRRIARECIEFAKRDYQSFIEIDRHGCTVAQCGPMRITIAQPPFSDGLEITAVRPVFKATLDDYELPDEVLGRLEEKARGVFIAGPPGSGKSTFAAAAAEHFLDMQRVVKTMEAPRDLQVPKEITQYAPLDKDMAWTGEIMLLVRPDHVVYDEVRTTSDFQVFADMRLAGIGLLGVTHANRAIDAVQRLVGRVDLGMIPQIVDTVVFIDAGQIAQILEIEFTVRVPAGMMQDDLARPVVVVKDFETKKEVYELYSFGEQIVVMPLEGQASIQMQGRSRGRGSRNRGPNFEQSLRRALGRSARGHIEVEIAGDSATVRAEPEEVPNLIGKGGRNVQMLEKRFGVSINVEPLHPRTGPRTPVIRRTGSNVFLILEESAGGHVYRVDIEGAVVGEVKASREGKIRFKSASPEGKALLQAARSGLDVRCVPV